MTAAQQTPEWILRVSNGISVSSFRRMVNCLDAAGFDFAVTYNEYINIIPLDRLFTGYRYWLKSVEERMDCGRGWLKVIDRDTGKVLAQTGGML